MPKSIIISLFVLLTSLAWSFDSAAGLGKGNIKLETNYTADSLGLNYRMGLSEDIDIFAATFSSRSYGGMGGGIRVMLLNERKGNSLSVGTKATMILSESGTMVLPEIILSKKLENLTAFTNYWSYTAVNGKYIVGMNWLGVGGLWDLNPQDQISLALGAVSSRGANGITNGIGLGLGYNHQL